MWGLSLVSESRAYFPVEVCGLLIAVASLVAEHRLSACRLQWWLHMDSVAVALRLRCSEACGIFPDERSNWCPLHCQADS